MKILPFTVILEKIGIMKNDHGADLLIHFIQLLKLLSKREETGGAVNSRGSHARSSEKGRPPQEAPR